MTRVAIVADSHFDASPGGRFEECIRIHDWIADDIAARDVDLVLHSGDVFERKSNPTERRAVASWLQKVAEHAPVVIVRGNHDAPGDLSIFQRLRTKYPVIVEEAAAVHEVAGVSVGCMAWPTKAHVLAGMGILGHQAGELAAGEAMRNVLRGLGEQMKAHGGPRILLAHAMVTGSRVSTGQPLMGCDLEIGLDDLGLAGADLYALGHIHMPQTWTVPQSVIYPGSPRRTAFGEVEEKGYVVIDCDGHDVKWQRIPTPCTQMILAEGVYADGRIVLDEACRELAETSTGAEIRLRYTVDAEAREAGKAAAAELRDWLMTERAAAFVKPDPQLRATTRARSPEVAAAQTLADKLRACWQARDDMPTDDIADRLIGKANELEREVSDAL